ncbi:MAG: PmoA family protein [Gemmataceae bacterium]|nr:PmoA family protein [Gemmataceae bacterium]
MFLLTLLVALADEPARSKLTVSAGKHDREDELVRVPVEVPAADHHSAALFADGKRFEVALLSAEGEAPKGKERLLACFVLPKLAAGKTAELSLAIRRGKSAELPKGLLSWRENPEPDSPTLLLAREKLPVLEFVRPTLDESTPAKREATFKPFHEAFLDGKKLTKGVGGLFTHHRGLFYGFMKASYGKHTVDIWHCKGKTHQAHRKVLDDSIANAVLGYHRVAIDWNVGEGKTFAKEERELTAIPLPGGLLIEFVSKLTPTGEDVKLDGDPQHAGFHFRAANEVDKNKKETFFIRPSGVGEKGKEKNWPGDKKQVDLPWLGMSFVIGGERYTVGYIDHPSNPKPAMFSERTYGRIGSYFVTTVKKDKPLVVRYRVWLQKGEAKAEKLAALAKSFAEPAEVKVEAR